MKTLRLIVSIRLAFFSLIFNLSIAQELEANTNESSWISDSEVKEPENETPMDSYVVDVPQKDSLLSSWEGEGYYVQIDNFNAQDSSLHSEWQVNPQNDNDVVPLYERGYGEADGIFSDEEEKILNPSDNSFQKGAQEVDTQDSSAENLELQIPPLSPLTEGGQYVPNLIISEIYRLWTTERIEITNLSDEDFSWKLSLSWAKSSLYTKNLDIPSYTSIILADKAEVWLINDEILAVNNAWFNITDSDEISISLIYSWNEIDTFNVDKSVVSNNQIPTSKPRPTFQKFYNNWREVQITTELDLYNITWSFIANPWKIINFLIKIDNIILFFKISNVFQWIYINNFIIYNIINYIIFIFRII